jgi:hypothetical protein
VQVVDRLELSVFHLVILDEHGLQLYNQLLVVPSSMLDSQEPVSMLNPKLEGRPILFEVCFGLSEIFFGDNKFQVQVAEVHGRGLLQRVKVFFGK